MFHHKIVRMFGAVALSIAPFEAVQSQSHSDLQTMVQQFQSNPSDTALRQRIIQTARQLKPALAVPEAAREQFVQGTTIAQSAKDAAGQALAVKRFEEALKIAPWWGDALYNLAVAQELAGQFDAAQESLRLYMLTGLNQEEARKAQDRIYALKAKKELAAAEANSPAARKAALLRSLDGGVWAQKTNYAFNYNNGSTWPKEEVYNPVLFISVQGNEMRGYQSDFPDRDRFKVQVSGEDLEFFAEDAKHKIAIVEGGQTIVIEKWAQPQPSMYWKQEFRRIK